MLRANKMRPRGLISPQQLFEFSRQLDAVEAANHQVAGRLANFLAREEHAPLCRTGPSCASPQYC